MKLDLCLSEVNRHYACFQENKNLEYLNIFRDAIDDLLYETDEEIKKLVREVEDD